MNDVDIKSDKGITDSFLATKLLIHWRFTKQ